MLTTDSQVSNIGQDILGKIISTERRDILEEVNALTPEQLQMFSHYMPIDLQDYVSKQTKWIQDSIYYLGIDSGHVPTAAEISDKLLNTDHSLRYRAYYALKYPDRVRKFA